jgi:hypothetical protein
MGNIPCCTNADFSCGDGRGISDRGRSRVRLIEMNRPQKSPWPGKAEYFSHTHSYRMPMVRQTLCRKFNIVDAMILIGAVAIGIAMVREARSDPNGLLRNNSPMWRIHDRICFFGIMFVPYAPAWLCLRMRHPRPASSDLIQQPGVRACRAACFALLVSPVPTFMFRPISVHGPAPFSAWFYTWGYAVSCLTGLSILVVWLCMAVSRSWHSEPSWIDRGGRILGFFWLIILPLIPITEVTAL